MFPADTLNSAYCEERDTAYAAKRLAQEQAEAARLKTAASCSSAAQQARPKPTHTQSSGPSAHSLSQALRQQRPPLSRPASSGFLGNIMQGFAKAKSASSTGSMTPPRSGTTTPIKEKSLAEMEALIAEKKRDADICAMPSW